MSKQFEKMVTLLKELFQLDQPDLDFGLYRVMHAKSGEITQFLEQDLLPQVKTAFGQYTTADKAELEKELKKAIEQANGLGVDPETTAKVKELRQKITDESVDVSALENEVYDYLFSFFRRYYHEGDFLSKRVYKPGVYAIPYEGEEVKLHWANRDQYYIKTSEYLRDYAFTLRPGDATDPMRVHFRLVDAVEGEHGNVKAAEGKDRVFILADDDFITEEEGELVIRFHYRPATKNDWSDEALVGATAAAKKKPPVQKELLSDAVRRVFAADGQDFKRWLDELSKAHVKANGEMADYSRLQGHLDRYFKRNTFDYFIHKDLGGFLRRELDFYIKNEVMHLDDVESESVPRVEQYLSKIKVIRKIAHKLIDFLAQLEEFQRTLWLKSKFVVETSYCITIDRVPEDFYAQIVDNESQWKQWSSLGLLPKDGEHDLIGDASVRTLEYLKSNQSLMIDTMLFESDFVDALIDRLEHLDDSIDGILINGDNFHAIRLIQNKYKNEIDGIYIDPPYNTDASPIIYKNGYKHSTWASMFVDRMSIASDLLKPGRLVCVAIDDFEYPHLFSFMEGELGFSHIGTAAVRSKPQGRPTATGFSANHEYAVFWARTEAPELGRLPRKGTKAERYPHADDKGIYSWANFRKSGTDSDRSDRKKSFYPVYVCGEKIRVPEMQWNPDTEEWELKEQPRTGEAAVWPVDTNGREKVWTCSAKRLEGEIRDVKVISSGNGGIELQKKYRPNQAGALPGTWWDSSEYSASESGTKVLKDLFGDKGFDFPKSINLVVDNLRVLNVHGSSIILDYFAGSGTTACAAISLNREDQGFRKYIMAEQGAYFDSVIKPRIQKVVYASDWKGSRPKNPISGISHAFKVLRIEGYEDAINNLDIRRAEAQQSLLDTAKVQGADGLKEQYMLRYMLDVETRGSQSLLNIAAFNDPTAYRLKVKRPGGIESSELNVDLVETFNYLIGLMVQSIAAPQTFQAAFKRDDEGRLRIDGRLRQDEAGPWWFRTVYGTTPEGRRTLIIWRKLTGDAEQDNLVLDEWFTRQGYSTRDYEFDMIYVNGDSNLENLRAPDETWKVRLIEEDFHRLMFDMTGL